MTISQNIRIHTTELSTPADLDATIEWELTASEAWIKISRPDGQTYTSRGGNLWDCLKEIRNQVEPLGVRILCNASRLDCYPSAMAIQMGGGYRVVVRTMGHPVADLSSVVDSFGPAQLEQIGTVEEQESYYRAWLRSLPRP